MARSGGLLVTFEFPPHPGGVGTYAYQIAANLYAMGVPVQVLARPSKQSYQDDAAFDQAQPFPIYRFRRWRTQVLVVIGRIVELFVFCLRHRIDWIYCCSYKAAYGALLCRFLLGIPYFLVGYGSDFAESSKTKGFLLRHALGVYAISHYTASLMRAQCDREVTTIPLGADARQFKPSEDDLEAIRVLREKYDIRGSPILLSVGRLNPRKGHDVTLKALPHIKAEYPDIQLVIIGRSMAGENKYEAELQSLIETYDLAESVAFIPMVSPVELKGFYSLADVFILSSRKHRNRVEGFGIVLIEANLMRTPVVASNSGGIVDAVEHNRSGLLYQAESVEDLAEKVLCLLRDESLRSNIGNYGRERALREFNWQLVADRTWRAIEERLR